MMIKVRKDTSIQVKTVKDLRTNCITEIKLEKDDTVKFYNSDEKLTESEEIVEVYRNAEIEATDGTYLFESGDVLVIDSRGSDRLRQESISNLKRRLKSYALGYRIK